MLINATTRTRHLLYATKQIIFYIEIKCECERKKNSLFKIVSIFENFIIFFVVVIAYNNDDIFYTGVVRGVINLVVELIKMNF